MLAQQREKSKSWHDAWLTECHGLERAETRCDEAKEKPRIPVAALRESEEKANVTCLQLDFCATYTTC